ncbi:DUF5134 domain-containing protein [Mycobacterium sp.]|uniref:DUF5134 domain-containing protein n=1 Tax=Mycobacterium sp. TaxID=1785 RepID=UPI003C77C8ED
MIQDLSLRWVVTLLFGLSAAAFVWLVAGGHRRRTNVVAQLLHVVMSVAMVVMAWPEGAKLPTTGPMVFFLLATTWFAAVALTRVGAGHRVINTYDGVMMLAMAWMYAVMNGQLLPGQSGGHHRGAMPEMNMPGMEMPGMDMSGQGMSMPGGTVEEGYPGWITAVNWVIAIGFALATVFWIYWYFRQRHRGPGERTHHPLAVAGHALMAAGMAIMFAVML